MAVLGRLDLVDGDLTLREKVRPTTEYSQWCYLYGDIVD